MISIDRNIHLHTYNIVNNHFIIFKVNEHKDFLWIKKKSFYLENRMVYVMDTNIA